MVNADLLKKVAIYGATLSCLGAAFFHHRIQGIPVMFVAFCRVQFSALFNAYKAMVRFTIIKQLITKIYFEGKTKLMDTCNTYLYF